MLMLKMYILCASEGRRGAEEAGVRGSTLEDELARERVVRQNVDCFVACQRGT